MVKIRHQLNAHNILGPVSSTEILLSVVIKTGPSIAISTYTQW